MTTKFEVKKQNDILFLKVYTWDMPDEAQVFVQQSVTKDLFINAGNLIDRSTLPFRICYLLVKAYQEKLHFELIKSSYFIVDDKLRNDVINYARDLNDGKVGLLSENEFKEFVNLVKEKSEEW